MAKVEYIISVLYEGLYDYVPNRNKKKFREEFANRKTLTAKFALNFFPKYIDFEKCSKKPKHPYDMVLINYWMIEVPVIGLKTSKLFTSYNRGNSIINITVKKKTDRPMKLTLNKNKTKTIVRNSTK